jgi:hypothetical protein
MLTGRTIDVLLWYMKTNTNRVIGCGPKPTREQVRKQMQAGVAD